ncbi:hypothetical protein NVP1259O_16 [Vibrio phage 1.259.O._10N.286.48.F4]|nr:hypothetical protein NVP1259O_16 [Vibrio phage 1.259.O._10N.286.48.F4]
MAIGGKYPILLVGTVDVLTPSESQLLKRLSAMSYPLGAETQKATNDATVSALKEKAAAMSELSIADLARMPIVIDGEIIPADVQNYGALMVKQLSVVEGVNTTTQAANTVSITIKTSRSSSNSIFIDLLFSVADIIFSKSDLAPSVSFFGGSIAIPNGYLIRLARNGGSTNSEETITLEIAKDLSFLFGAQQDFLVGAEKAIDVTAVDDVWQAGATQ